MTTSRTILAFIATTILGAFTYFLTGAKKGLKNKLQEAGYSKKEKNKDNLFI